MTLFDLLDSALDRRFQRFHTENPEVFRELRALALDLKRRGHRRCGIKMLFEVLRWQRMLVTSDPEGWKLNNNYHSRYARLVDGVRAGVGRVVRAAGDPVVTHPQPPEVARPRKCASCHRRRNLRGWVLCDECSYDWWDANGGYQWTRDMKEFGWAASPASPTEIDEATWRINLLVEQRWMPTSPQEVPSRLWDKETPSTGMYGQWMADRRAVKPAARNVG